MAGQSAGAIAALIATSLLQSAISSSQAKRQAALSSGFSLPKRPPQPSALDAGAAAPFPSPYNVTLYSDPIVAAYVRRIGVV